MTTYVLLAMILFAIFLRYRSQKAQSIPMHNISVSAVDQLVNNDKAILIDVRKPKEINRGKIGTPLEIELTTSIRKKLIELDRNRKYIGYCQSGGRSVVASKIMLGMGFADVNNLLGGYSAWTKR